MNAEKKTISFRKRALEYVNRPVLLDDALQIITVRNWLSLAILLICIAAFLAWLIWGKLFIQVQGNGLLLSLSNDIVTVQSSQEESSIKKINVKTGQKVTKDTVLVEMNNDLETQLALKKTFLNQLKSQERDLLRRSKNILSYQETSKAEEVVQIKASLEAAREKLKQVATMQTLKEQAYKKGIIDLPNLTATRISYYELLQEIRAHEAELIAKQANITDLRDKWRERVRELALLVHQTEYDYKLLEKKWQEGGLVKSPTAGIVAEIRVRVGDHVKAGQPILSIIPEDENLYALVFVPAAKSKLIQIGMPAEISPTMINKLEYGTIKGRVESVSVLPITQENMMTLLKNEDLVRFFLGQTPLMSVKILLNKNAVTPSGYQWTNSKGPNMHLTQGTLIETRINVETKRPIDLLLNTLRK